MTDAKGQGRALRLLVVEDNPVEREFLSAALRRARSDPMEVTLAESLAEARTAVQAHYFDAILLDLSLPDSDGIETFRRMRADSPELPIVVLTVSEDEAQALLALQEGAQDYLFKGTVDRQALVRSMRYAVERHRLQLALERQTRRLSEHLNVLRGGFSRLAAGDLGIRISGDLAEGDEADGLTGLLEDFDQTVERLRSLSELKAQFSSMVSHDLRSPMNTILMAVSALEALPDESGEQERFLGIIRRKASRILQLAEELLEVFTIEAGQMSLTRSEVDLNQMLASCLEDLTPQALARRQVLQLQPLAGPSRVVCDAAKIARVVENLVNNALKYSVEGDTILVRATRVEPGRVQIEVIDHGSGIPDEELRRVFDLFYRSPAREHLAAGAGLGLGICRAFVRAHGGEIWALNQPDGGARFAFELPQ